MQVSPEIRLTRIKLTNALEIFEAIQANREYLREWLPFVDDTISVEDSKEFINYVNSTGEKIYLIYYNGEFAGLIGFKDTDVLNQKTEIGYWLLKKFQHKGIMTNSVKALLKYAFEDLDINRVQIKAAVKNQKSRHIPERLGFLLEGIERDGEQIDDKFIDLAIYSLLKTEYTKLKILKSI